MCTPVHTLSSSEEDSNGPLYACQNDSDEEIFKTSSLSSRLLKNKADLFPKESQESTGSSLPVSLTTLSSDDEDCANIQDFTVIHNEKPSKQLSMKERKLFEKAERRLEREAKKKEKERSKLEKEQARLAKKAEKPGECLKSLVVQFDRALLELPQGSELLATLAGANIQYKILDSLVANAITFHRMDILTQEEIIEKEAIIFIPLDDFLPLVHAQIYGSSALRDTTDLCKKCQMWRDVLCVSSITILVSNLEEHFRKLNVKEQRRYRKEVLGEESTASRNKRKTTTSDIYPVTRVDVESSFVAAQMEGTSHRLVNTPLKLAEFVAQVAKSIAERPYKLQRNNTTFNWYAEGSNINAVKVDKSGVGLLKLWHQQLRQFNNVGIETAQAIAKEYPSPMALFNAFLRAAPEEAPLILADIPVRRGTGPLANTRRIGPELSRKIFTFFTSSNPSRILGQT